MSEAWIIDGVRSPRGRGKAGVGSLSEIHPQRIMAQVLNGLKDKVGFDPADVEDFVAAMAQVPATMPTISRECQY
jgi:acetyl-CoA C-acetyltransferase